jgi:Cytochrome c7 and related cytochrome c
VIDGKHLDLKCNDCHIPKKQKPIYHWEKLLINTCENCHKSPHVGNFSKELLSKKCTICHVTEGWYSQKTDSGFDHNKTRFPLTGAHKGARCSNCHGETKKQVFKFKDSDKKFCIQCHENIHINQFTSKMNTANCTECHTTENFKQRLQFDHEKTGYSLKGAHTPLKCDSCHTSNGQFNVLKWPNFKTKDKTDVTKSPAAQYKFPNLSGKKCLTCHQDVHDGQLGSACTLCHNETKWKDFKFDHNSQSRFSLNGKHMTLECAKCHKPTDKKVSEFKRSIAVIQFRPLKSACIDCHKDPHKSNFGNQCQECHNERGWKVTKDFHKNFTLTGVHYSLECTECHREGKKLAGLSQQCINCHQKDDIHNGALPNCKQCHTQQFWEVTSFRHSMSEFPLRGAHRVLECSECHKNGAYKGLSTSCFMCHSSDFDAFPVQHQGTARGTECTQCHRNTFTFKNSK